MRPSRNYLAWFVCLIIGATILSLVPSTAIAADEDSADDGLLGGALAPLTSVVAPVVDTAEAAVAPVPVVGGAVETVTGAIEPLAPVAGGAVNTVDSTVAPVTGAVPTDIVAGAEAPAAPVEDEGSVCIAIYPPPPGCGPAADASSGADASVNANPAGAADANAAVSADSTFAADAQAVQAQAVPVAAQAQPVQVVSANSGWGTRTDTASQQVITAIGGAQQNPCGNNTASLLFVTQQDFGACADSNWGGGWSGGGSWGGNGNDTASQQVITAIGGAQQNPCGNNTASLLFVTQQDFGSCAQNGYGANNTFVASSGAPVAGAQVMAAEAQAVPVAVGSGYGYGYGRTDTASQQVITAIGGAQQNPCGNNTASLLFVTQQDFGACADSGYGGGGGVGGGVGAGYGNDTASQQVITAIGGAQQNPCGNNTASLLFVTQQDFGACAQNSYGANNTFAASSGNTMAAAEAQAVPMAVGTGAGYGYGRTDTASQQVITAIGGAQQNPCGNNTASLLFVTQQDFGACADSGYGGGGVGGGVGAGYGNDTASQQVITAIGGAQQNPCGNNTASLLFVTQQDFGACAQNNVAANNGVVVSGNAAPVAVSGGSQAPVAQAPNNNGGGGIPVVGNLPIVGQVLGGGGGGLPVVGNVLGGGGLPIVGNLPVVGGLL